MAPPKYGQPPVLVRRMSGLTSIVLNRPRVLNSLNHDMIRMIRKAMESAQRDDSVNMVMFYGAGDKGFCAGGDVKAMAQSVREGNPEAVLEFLEEEYALDLMIHRFPKPVIVMADGITMGGGLGLSAGADIVLATERTRSAMPETRIGFFPDVGATGWMYHKCPPGYPEYLGLTGYEMTGSECVRVGFATHLTESRDLEGVRKRLEDEAGRFSGEKSAAVDQVTGLLRPFLKGEVPGKPEMDHWVKTYFQGKISLTGMLEDLRECSIFSSLCEGVFQRLSERSPTALAVTLQLLRHNEGLPLEEVFRADLRAARFIVSHPDYLEGVRARLVDRDDRPRWQPESIEKVGGIDLNL